jgi:hypothetical protein
MKRIINWKAGLLRRGLFERVSDHTRERQPLGPLDLSIIKLGRNMELHGGASANVCKHLTLGYGATQLMRFNVNIPTSAYRLPYAPKKRS